VAQLTIPAEFADPARVLAAAVAGNVDALERIVVTHHADMSRIAFVVCGDVDLAAEAVQSAWHIAWRKLGSVRQPDRLRQWLMSVAANEARQLVRKRRGRQLVEIEVADVGTNIGDPSARAVSLDLEAAMRRLSPDDRAILALRHVGGYDATEIGRALGMPPASVRTRLARTIARLRTELSDV
jgi:RNA polymerase sigma-70 factor (ECF subfamily)